MTQRSAFTADDLDDRVGGFFDAFEGWWEDVFDGLRRRLGASIEPVTIQHRLAEQMRSRVSFYPGRIVAPNRFRVLLSPRDFAEVGGHVGSLERELARGLVGNAVREGLTFLCDPIVELVADPLVVPGRLIVECGFADAGREPSRWWSSHPRRPTGRAVVSRRPSRPAIRRATRALRDPHDGLPVTAAVVRTPLIARSTRAPRTPRAGHRLRWSITAFGAIVAAASIAVVVLFGAGADPATAVLDAALAAGDRLMRVVGHISALILEAAARSTRP